MYSWWPRLATLHQQMILDAAAVTITTPAWNMVLCACLHEILGFNKGPNVFLCFLLHCPGNEVNRILQIWNLRSKPLNPLNYTYAKIFCIFNQWKVHYFCKKHAQIHPQSSSLVLLDTSLSRWFSIYIYTLLGTITYPLKTPALLSRWFFRFSLSVGYVI